MNDLIETVIAILNAHEFEPGGYAHHNDSIKSPVDPLTKPFTHIGIHAAVRVATGDDDAMYRWLAGPHVGKRYENKEAAIAALKLADYGEHPWVTHMRKALETNTHNAIYSALTRIPTKEYVTKVEDSLTLFGLTRRDYRASIALIMTMTADQRQLFLDMIQ